MSDLATSAGYMTAIAADRIFARRSTVTGSIGVIMQTTDITGLLGKIGIKPEAIKSAPLKAQPNPLEPMSAKARAAAQAVVTDMFEMFVEMVVERRKMTKSKVTRLADGRVYTGRQALQNGLIDAIGGENEALAWLELRLFCVHRLWMRCCVWRVDARPRSWFSRSPRWSWIATRTSLGAPWEASAVWFVDEGISLVCGCSIPRSCS